jgi:hypothetical protein
MSNNSTDEILMDKTNEDIRQGLQVFNLNED